MKVEVEVLNRFTHQLNIYPTEDIFPTRILVYLQDSVGYSRPYGEARPLYESSIAIQVNRMGNLLLVKNRCGSDMVRGEQEVREEIFNDFHQFGINNVYQKFNLIDEINRSVAKLSGQPILYTIEYPLGLSQHEYNKRIEKLKPIYKIKKFNFV